MEEDEANEEIAASMDERKMGHMQAVQRYIHASPKMIVRLHH